MTGLAYNIITRHADDMRDWQTQFEGYALSHIIDIAYNYLTDEESEELRVRLAETVAIEIFGMIQPGPDNYEEDE